MNDETDIFLKGLTEKWKISLGEKTLVRLLSLQTDAENQLAATAL